MPGYCPVRGGGGIIWAITPVLAGCSVNRANLNIWFDNLYFIGFYLFRSYTLDFRYFEVVLHWFTVSTTPDFMTMTNVNYLIKRLNRRAKSYLSSTCRCIGFDLIFTYYGTNVTRLYLLNHAYGLLVLVRYRYFTLVTGLPTFQVQHAVYLCKFVQSW